MDANQKTNADGKVSVVTYIMKGHEILCSNNRLHPNDRMHS